MNTKIIIKYNIKNKHRKRLIASPVDKIKKIYIIWNNYIHVYHM